jgi:hypothetical protein
MANFNSQQHSILEVADEYIQQNNDVKRLTPAALQLLTASLAPNYDIEVDNGTLTLRRQGELIGRIRQREVHRAIHNIGEPGQPRPRLRYHDVVDIIIEVANENHRNMVEDAVRQALNMGARLNLADFPLEGSPMPEMFGQPGVGAPNRMNLEGGRKRSRSKRNRRSLKKHRKTRRRT